MSNLQKYRLVRAPQGSPAWNQAYEEVMFQQGEGLPLLMLWQNQPAVVCGKHQHLYGEVNVWQAHQAGLALVRRESGGGTVSHSPGNLNYTMVHELTGSWEAADFARPVIACLRELGTDAALFDNAGIAVSGLKVSGSAQRVSGSRILHHGTLLFDADLSWVNQSLHRSPFMSQCRGTRSRPATIGNIRPALRQDMNLDAFEAYLIKRLCLDQAAFAPADKGAIAALARDKYESWDWTFARSPRFHYEKPFPFQGKGWVLSFDCEAGHLNRVSIRITGQEKQELAALFESQRLDPASLQTHTARFLSAEWAEELLPHFFG